MKILILNAGSSTIKFQVFDVLDNMHMIVTGELSKIGEAAGSTMAYSIRDKKFEESKPAKDHGEGLAHILEILMNKDHKIIENDYKKELLLIGHRVVHGGEEFLHATIVNDSVLEKIEQLSELAPLHNPVNAKGIRESMKVFSGVPNVAAFDTSFHVRSLPPVAYRYALPAIASKKVRRYGFHGTSHEYVTHEAAKLIGKPVDQVNLITLHLGNGCSMCAIRNGKSVETSMGLTPLEGLIMGTRCGDIDPAVVTHLMTNAGITLDPFQTEKLLNQQSGLKGICGSNDMREVINKMENGDQNAVLAYDMFCYRIRKYIGQYFAVLEGEVDAIVFTAGIGTNSINVRKTVCGSLQKSFGVHLDEEKNKKMNKNNPETWHINCQDSTVKIIVIPTNEELEIAKQAYDVLMQEQQQNENKCK